MTISPKLKEYLDQHSISYDIVSHRETFTSQETAGAQHIPGAQLLKAVILICDGQRAMAVLSANQLVDLEKFKEVSGALDVALAPEKEMRELFPDYELGAEPPFGNFHGLSVFVDSALESSNTIYFSAGTHKDLVKVSFFDYLQLAKPVTIADFGKQI